MDNLVANKSKTSYTDKQAQDCMMRCFFPAAKPMTLQPLQHAQESNLSWYNNLGILPTWLGRKVMDISV